MPGTTPTLSELYRLAQQLELDKEVPVQQARERDHAIAASCTARDDLGRLQCWLAAVSAQRRADSSAAEPWLTEASMAALGRVMALFLGFLGMATFLLASGRGLVNVFAFLLVFVLVQLVLSVIAAVVMARTLGGHAPLVLPLNPARLLVARTLPDRRYLREAQSVLRLLLLRYGQELGAIFTLGAIAAFLSVLLLSDFTFVWGSTFQLSDSLVEQMTAVLAAPWSSWLPAATVGGDLIFASRYHPAVTSLSPADIEQMRGWWPFLIMCMACYALLPRVLLWLLSRVFHARRMRLAFARLPGSERVLARMKSPVLRTQGEGSERSVEMGTRAVAPNPGLVLLNWANALDSQDPRRYEEFGAVAEGRAVDAGLGSLPEEVARLRATLGQDVEQLLVAVKSWEPPMADLADFLENFSTVPRCTLFLVPLPRKAVSATGLGDWQVFSRSLGFAAVDVRVLGED